MGFGWKFLMPWPLQISFSQASGMACEPVMPVRKRFVVLLLMRMEGNYLVLFFIFGGLCGGRCVESGCCSAILYSALSADCGDVVTGSAVLAAGRGVFSPPRR